MYDLRLGSFLRNKDLKLEELSQMVPLKKHKLPFSVSLKPKTHKNEESPFWNVCIFIILYNWIIQFIYLFDRDNAH